MIAAPVAPPGKRRQTLYLPSDMANEIAGEAVRQDRSICWLMQRAWRLARAEVARFPARPVLPAPRPEGK
jgi:uncharacterized small protein (TIGR04563 family)